MSRKAAVFTKKVQRTVENSSGQFGSATLTPKEFAALQQLRKKLGSQEATREHLIEKGFPMLKEISPKDVAIAGIAHACGVIVNLTKQRGQKGARATFESYTTKNRFDRFVRRKLPQGLRGDWDTPVERKSPRSEWNKATAYPPGVDESKVHGASKPERFFPAQLMKTLEFARLGKLDKNTESALGITQPEDRAKFGISWDSLEGAIKQSDNLVDIAANIGSSAAEQLIQNGLSAPLVAAVLKKGYNVPGFTEEYSEVAEAQQVYGALLGKLEQSPATREVYALMLPPQQIT